MTSSSNSTMGVQLTPGQRCLLDLLQRKLLKTVHYYAKLKQQTVSCNGSQQNEEELLRLREKIKRISARQKRFTLEIINGNGNNTIPKESFFEALGLVTKEALSKLNSKTNERRRRTTANPRFSHEAIQAKRALEPLSKRLESRVTKDKRETSGGTNNNNNNNNGKRNQRNQQHNTNNTSNNTNSNNIESNNRPNVINNTRSGGNNNNNSNNNNTNSNSSTSSSKNNQQALGNNNGNVRSSNRSASSRQRNLISQSERQEVYNQYRNLQKQINSKMSIIERKQASIEKLHKDNQLIKKRYLDLIDSAKFIEVKHEDVSATATTRLENNADESNNNNINSDNTNQNDHQQVASQTEIDHQHHNVQQPMDMWIDMKCDESLDGLD